MRPIDADALLKGKEDHEMISTHLIFNAPTLDVKPATNGKWIFNPYTTEKHSFKCNNCEWYNIRPTNFCPNCGADMREVEE